MAVFFVVAVKVPVGVGFVSGSGFLGYLFLHEEDMLLKLSLFHQQFGVVAAAAHRGEHQVDVHLVALRAGPDPVVSLSPVAVRAHPGPARHR